MGLMNRRDVWNELEVNTHEIPTRKQTYDDLLWRTYIWGAVYTHPIKSSLKYFARIYVKHRPRILAKPLGKYSRRVMWNVVRRSSAKPLGKYSRRVMWNVVRRSSTKPLGKYSRRVMWNVVRRC